MSSIKTPNRTRTSSQQSSTMMSSTSPPWEPYKAATTNASIIPPNTDSLIACFKRDGLVKYKLDTNLDEFNSTRPGSQFDESDLSMVDKCTGGANIESFLDARFYTDASFLKLAAQLRNRLNPTTSSSSSSSSPSASANQTTQPPVKPVNIVGPYIPKKPSSSDVANQATSTTTTTTPTATATTGKTTTTISRNTTSQQENYEKQLQYLETQLQGMQEQLSIQTQVNQELKKMLVAAIGGEDMQYRLERLVNDKQRFEIELASNAKQMERMSEQIEQISIQCDLWRSKFLASKMMADELSTWKTFLIMMNNQSEKVVKNLLNENDLINHKLNTALNILNTLKDNKSSSENSSKRTLNSIQQKSQNNLQLINVLLAKLAQLDSGASSNLASKHELLREISTSHLLLNKQPRSRTLNELVAEEALEQFEWVKAASVEHYSQQQQQQQQQQQMAENSLSTLDRLETLIKHIKQSRIVKFGRLYQPESLNSSDLMLNVCNKCKGDIKTV